MSALLYILFPFTSVLLNFSNILNISILIFRLMLPFKSLKRFSVFSVCVCASCVGASGSQWNPLRLALQAIVKGLEYKKPNSSSLLEDRKYFKLFSHFSSSMDSNLFGRVCLCVCVGVVWFF